MKERSNFVTNMKEMNIDVKSAKEGTKKYKTKKAIIVCKSTLVRIVLKAMTKI